MANKYRFLELSEKSKKRAILDYLTEWNESNPNDPFSEEGCEEFLTDHNDDDFYTKDGKIIN